MARKTFGGGWTCCRRRARVWSRGDTILCPKSAKIPPLAPLRVADLAGLEQVGAYSSIVHGTAAVSLFLFQASAARAGAFGFECTEGEGSLGPPLHLEHTGNMINSTRPLNHVYLDCSKLTDTGGIKP